MDGLSETSSRGRSDRTDSFLFLFSFFFFFFNFRTPIIFGRTWGWRLTTRYKYGHLVGDLRDNE